jgi:anaerobic magnesium-protoporphyrin IX monomethyl ester cyclase
MKVLLATLHARYVHASLALPCLAAACMGIDGVTTVIREFTVNEPRDETLRRIVAEDAHVAAFSCYIWNIRQTLELAADLKKIAPGTFIILGGPEASFGSFEIMERHRSVDCIVKGEGEETFRELIAAMHNASATPQLLTEIDGLVCRSGEDIVAAGERAPVSDLDTIPSPFARGLVDLAKPLVYFETSRGCPFSCAFCMSSLEKGVRSFSAARIRDDLQMLMEGGARTVKFVDRTFNYDARRANDIWDFILGVNRESSFHFEIAADLLTEENFALLEKAPPGVFRFEIGIQSGNEETLARVGRTSDLEKLSANVRRLVSFTGVIVHLDLVAGLPHEDYDGFLDSLQTVFDLLDPNNPYSFVYQGGEKEATEAYESVRRGASDETNTGRRKKTDCFIQVEPLKVLKGSPMRKIARDEGYRFSDTPPYKILSTPWLTFGDIGRIEAIARLIDLFCNSGRFGTALDALARAAPRARILDSLARFREGRDTAESRSLAALFEEFWEFGEGYTAGDERERLREALCYDYALAECPAAGNLPRFFQWSDGGGVHVSTKDLARSLDIAKGSRVRAFRRRFASDPRRGREGLQGVVLLFVYISAPGRGLEVRVLDANRPRHIDHDSPA